MRDEEFDKERKEVVVGVVVGKGGEQKNAKRNTTKKVRVGTNKVVQK